MRQLRRTGLVITDTRWCVGLLLAVSLGWPLALAAQAPSQAALERAAVAAAVNAEPSDETALLTFYNRPIVSLRARVLGRRPSERAATAVATLEDLVARGTREPVAWHPFEGGVLIAVGPRAVLALMSPDIDLVAGETLEGIGARTATRLEEALGEAVDARAPGRFLRSVVIALAALLIAVVLLWVIVRAHRAVVRRLISAAEQTLARSGLADLDVLRASRLLDWEQRVTTALFVGLGLVITYITTTFVLRQFPFTRPWGESMRGFLLARIEALGLSMAEAVPGLFTVVLIVLMTRIVTRVIHVWFSAIERGRLTTRWIYPETAQPTRRLLTVLLWLFALAMAYPYLPGSQTEAFKGVSVFLGLMITFGSSGLVNQIASGFVITYSRALRLGDFVRVGDVEGTVSHLGVLSTKIKTLWSEEVTVPNALVIAQTTTDYSRLAETDGVFTPTSVTIGYDAPWRQVQALLLMAAERTPGLRREPKPLVLQTALEDFYVRYTLLVCLERQDARPFTLHTLYTHIQDLFNEYGVQIMSPNYLADPATPKIVARKDWHAAPADSAAGRAS